MSNRNDRKTTKIILILAGLVCFGVWLLMTIFINANMPRESHPNLDWISEHTSISWPDNSVLLESEYGGRSLQAVVRVDKDSAAEVVQSIKGEKLPDPSKSSLPWKDIDSALVYRSQIDPNVEIGIVETDPLSAHVYVFATFERGRPL